MLSTYSICFKRSVNGWYDQQPRYVIFWYSKTSLTRTSGDRLKTYVLTEVRVVQKLKKFKATVH